MNSPPWPEGVRRRYSRNLGPTLLPSPVVSNPSYLGRHVGEQKGLVAVFLTLSMVSGSGEMAAVESAVLEVGVLKRLSRRKLYS